jgi:two-component system, chemotaxis family, response regulator Rcp1
VQSRSDSAQLQVLIVEDNPPDVMLIQMALASEGLDFQAHVCSDGDCAVEHLSATDGIHPDLIILDLNLPKRNGTEVLHFIRGKESLALTPVVILSSSPEHVIEEAVHAAHVKADCYLTKPPSLDSFLSLGRVIIECYRTALQRNEIRSATSSSED